MALNPLGLRAPSSYEVRIYYNRRTHLLAVLTAPGGVITSREDITFDTTWQGPYVRGSFTKLDYVMTDNAVGALVLETPETLPWGTVGKDAQIEVWRAADGRATGWTGPQLEFQTLWLVTYCAVDLGSVNVTKIIAVDAMDLLDRRIVAYYAGSPQSQKTDQYDDMIKAIVNENMGPLATNGTRDLNDGVEYALGASFYVIPNAAAMQLGSKAFAWRSVLDVCQEIADTSAQLGGVDNYLSFRFLWEPMSGRLGFYTFAKSMGQDRRIGSHSPLILSPEMGNLTDVTIADDWRDEKTCVYVGGPGEGAARLVNHVESNDVWASPFGLKEAFIDARNAGDAATLEDLANEGRAELRLRRGRRTFTGKVSETDNTRYGIDYNLGFLVTAQAAGLNFNCRVKQVHVTVDANGDNVEAAIESTEELQA